MHDDISSRIETTANDDILHVMVDSSVIMVLRCSNSPIRAPTHRWT